MSFDSDGQEVPSIFDRFCGGQGEQVDDLKTK